MNITCISTGLFPDTHASAIRQSTLAKGLTEQGHNVRFLVLNPQNWEEKKIINYFNVQFQDLNNYKGTNKVLRHYYYIRAINKAKKIIERQVKKDNIDALIIFSFWIQYALPLYFLVRKAHELKIKIFHEITELPYVFDENKTWLNFYLKKLLPNFDGVFIISDKLKEYVQQFNKSTKKLLTVVDLLFFNTTKVSPYPFPYVGYCGTNTGNKDGIPILIEAFANIENRFPHLKLVIVGNNSNKEAIKQTNDALTKFNLAEKVIFTGQIPRDLMPAILCNAEILVVSKPGNEQNSGNFPIKIGEYLATGVPVVLTSVGEIPLFVEDGISGYLAEPGSAESFAKKMGEALGNPILAKVIGQAGKKVAETTFDYKIQSGVMAEYIATKINIGILKKIVK